MTSNIEIRQSGRGRTIRNGKVRKIEYFRHRADAVAAAGRRAEDQPSAVPIAGPDAYSARPAARSASSRS